MNTYTAGLIDSFLAGTGHVKNRFLALNSSQEVVLCGSGKKSIGASIFTTTVGDQAPVILSGIVPIEVGAGGITAGDLVTSDASGKAITRAALSLTAGATAVTSNAAAPTLLGGNLPQELNGIALETGDAGDIVRILLK